MKTYKDLIGWFNFSDFYDQVFDEFKNKKDIIFVEVGVWMGKSITYMANKFKEENVDIKLYGIDNFTGVKEYSDKPEHPTKTIANEHGGNFHQIYNQNLIDCGVRDYIIDIQKPSLDAVNDFEDESIDFIFIDGDHHYTSFREDLKAWYPKIKRGGIFSGHDIPNIGVIKGLNEFNKKNNIINKKTSISCWIIRK